MTLDPVKLGERVMLSRRRRGWTQLQLEEVSGVRVVTIARVERARMPKVSLDVVVRLATAMDASIDDWVGLREDHVHMNTSGQ
jgi:transcriptional regulator with XRE-family HTH domain